LQDEISNLPPSLTLTLNEFILFSAPYIHDNESLNLLEEQAKNGLENVGANGVKEWIVGTLVDTAIDISGERASQ